MDRGTGPVVATLGDRLESTCSIKLADQWLEGQGRIAGYLTFEAAARATLAGDADFLVVPGAYPGIKAIIFDDDLELEDVFKGELPPMVLVEAAIAASARSERLYLHPALHDLADQLDAERPRPFERVEVSSNAVACERVGVDTAAWALTNRTAAQSYAARELRVMRNRWLMPTSVFRRRSGEDVQVILASEHYVLQ